MSTGAGAAAHEIAGGVSLDAVFRSNVRARSRSIALVDAADRAKFTDGTPRRLTYAEADAAVDRLAARLHSFGIPAGSAVAVQLPGIVEAALSLLAIQRARLVAVPVPMAWGRSDLIAAFASFEPRALLTVARFGDMRPAEVACEVAAKLFQLSFPCAFGADLPDGVVSLDQPHDPAGRVTASPAPSIDQVAIATLDARPEGFFAVGRGNGQWLALGMAMLLEAKVASGDRIVTTLPLSSLAGIGAAFVPWLLSGGALEFSSGTSRGPAAGEHVHLIAPVAAIVDVARRHGVSLASATALHRAPHTRPYDLSEIASERILDVTVFGELGASVLRRDDRTRPKPISIGPHSAPAGSAGAPVVIEISIDRAELILRGPMLPQGPFPPASPTPFLYANADGFVRTGYRCHSDGNGALMIDGGPHRVATIGGLRFGLDDLESRIAKSLEGAKVELVGDPLLGERLRIEVQDPAAAAAALRGGGHSPLVIDAVAPAAIKRRAAG